MALISTSFSDIGPPCLLPALKGTGMKPTVKAGLTLAVSVLLCCSVARAGMRGQGKWGGQGFKIPSIRRQIHLVSVSDCSLERCQQLCEEHYGSTKLDVAGLCLGDNCKCRVRDPCRPMSCYNKCLRKMRGKVNVQANCVRHECFCKKSNDCEPTLCKKHCENQHKDKENVEGRCIGEDCSCTWDR